MAGEVYVLTCSTLTRVEPNATSCTSLYPGTAQLAVPSLGSCPTQPERVICRDTRHSHLQYPHSGRAQRNNVWLDGTSEPAGSCSTLTRVEPNATSVTPDGASTYGQLAVPSLGSSPTQLETSKALVS